MIRYQEGISSAEAGLASAGMTVGHLTPFDPVYVERLAATTKALTPQSGPVLAQMQAHGLI